MQYLHCQEKILQKYCYLLRKHFSRYFTITLTLSNQHYIILRTTTFVGKKWFNETPECLICDKTFLGNILKVFFNAPYPKSDAFVILGLKQKFIFLRWIFPNFFSETTLFIYFFPKLSADKRSSENLVLQRGMRLDNFRKCLWEFNIVLLRIVRVC